MGALNIQNKGFIFLGIQVDSNERVVVSTPGYLRNFTTILASEPKRNIANYMLWRASRASIGFLNKVYDLFQELKEQLHISNIIILARATLIETMFVIGCKGNNRRILKKCNRQKSYNSSMEIMCWICKWKFFCCCWKNVCSETF